MLVEVDDERLLGVRGDPDNPDSQGFLCVRGQASREIIGNPQRLLHPLVRARRGEDAWRRAEWAEVLDRIAATMRAVRREAVVPWSGHGLSARHYVNGLDALRAHLASHPPAWAAGVTGVEPDRIVALARRYATTRPAMIVLGGSSMHKGAGGWTGGRAIGCLPALTGNLGVPGGGLGPRHGSAAHGQRSEEHTSELQSHSDLV